MDIYIIHDFALFVKRKVGELGQKYDEHGNLIKEQAYDSEDDPFPSFIEYEYRWLRDPGGAADHKSFLILENDKALGLMMWPCSMMNRAILLDPITVQAALYGFLEKRSDLGLPLISVNQLEITTDAV